MEIEGNKLTSYEGKLLTNIVDYKRELDGEFEEFEGEKIYFLSTKVKTIYLGCTDKQENYIEI